MQAYAILFCRFLCFLRRQPLVSRHKIVIDYRLIPLADPASAGRHVVVIRIPHQVRHVIQRVRAHTLSLEVGSTKVREWFDEGASWTKTR